VFESHAVAVVYLVVETKRTGSETACLPACLVFSAVLDRYLGVTFGGLRGSIGFVFDSARAGVAKSGRFGDCSGEGAMKNEWRIK